MRIEVKRILNEVVAASMHCAHMSTSIINPPNHRKFYLCQNEKKMSRKNKDELELQVFTSLFFSLLTSSQSSTKQTHSYTVLVQMKEVERKSIRLSIAVENWKKITSHWNRKTEWTRKSKVNRLVIGFMIRTKVTPFISIPFLICILCASLAMKWSFNAFSINILAHT